jgi:predicted RNase H-like nuclease (RuvC/YqgF family)
MKFMTPSEAETKRQQAVAFLHRIGNDDLAEEFEAMDARDYAEHKGAALIENPKGRNTRMARKTIDDYKDENAELKDQVSELDDENQALREKLEDIVGIVNGDEEQEDGEDGEDDDDGEDEGDDGNDYSQE